MQHFLKWACLVIGLLPGVMGLTAASATDMDRQWPAVGRLNVTGGGFLHGHIDRRVACFDSCALCF
jgi:hypothetical protein